jgi:Helix-loop-helix DNA-binding domain
MHTLINARKYLRYEIDFAMKLQRKVEKRIFKAQRERSRMQEINRALELLKNILQTSISSELQYLPKIEIIKLSKNYIKILQKVLLLDRSLSNDEIMESLSLNLKSSTVRILQNTFGVNHEK